MSTAFGVLNDARARQRRRHVAIALAIVAALLAGSLVAGGVGGGRPVARHAAAAAPRPARAGAGGINTVGRHGSICLISAVRERRDAPHGPPPASSRVRDVRAALAARAVRRNSRPCRFDNCACVTWPATLPPPPVSRAKPRKVR